MRQSRLLLASAVVLLTETLMASETLPVRNDTGRMKQLWIYPYSVRDWMRPPVSLAPGERREVVFNSGETYYLVFMDDQGRETPIGRFNITNVLKENPTYELSIRRVTYTRCCMEQRVRRIWCPCCQGWHLIPETVTRPVCYEVEEVEWLSR
jgi:hypothetical protein